MAKDPASTCTFVVGITGASGAAYAVGLLHQLLSRGHTVHLVVTEFGRRLLNDEANIRTLDTASLLPDLLKSDPSVAKRLVIHPNKNIGAVIASGSFMHNGMVVIPASSQSLASIATGVGSNLLTRAAAVTLKERRTLIICHRETPLSLIDIENMRSVTLAGAIVCPTNPGLYLHPQRIEDLIDFIVGKVLDLLHVEHDLDTRWTGQGR